MVFWLKKFYKRRDDYGLSDKHPRHPLDDVHFRLRHVFFRGKENAFLGADQVFLCDQVR